MDDEGVDVEDGEVESEEAVPAVTTARSKAEAEMVNSSRDFRVNVK